MNHMQQQPKPTPSERLQQAQTLLGRQFTAHEKNKWDEIQYLYADNPTARVMREQALCQRSDFL